MLYIQSLDSIMCASPHESFKLFHEFKRIFNICICTFSPSFLPSELSQQTPPNKSRHRFIYVATCPVPCRLSGSCPLFLNFLFCTIQWCLLLLLLIVPLTMPFLSPATFIHLLYILHLGSMYICMRHNLKPRTAALIRHIHLRPRIELKIGI